MDNFKLSSYILKKLDALLVFFVLFFFNHHADR